MTTRSEYPERTQLLDLFHYLRSHPKLRSHSSVASNIYKQWISFMNHERPPMTASVIVPVEMRDRSLQKVDFLSSRDVDRFTRTSFTRTTKNTYFGKPLESNGAEPHLMDTRYHRSIKHSFFPNLLLNLHLSDSMNRFAKPNFCGAHLEKQSFSWKTQNIIILINRCRKQRHSPIRLLTETIWSIFPSTEWYEHS